MDFKGSLFNISVKQAKKLEKLTGIKDACWMVLIYEEKKAYFYGMTGDLQSIAGTTCPVVREIGTTDIATAFKL